MRQRSTSRSKTISFKDVEFAFEVDPAVKDKLLRGLDDIAESLMFEGEITTFETEHKTQLPTA